jgi:TnpA family transposase
MTENTICASPQERLRILSDHEIETLYGHPNFTQDEQAIHFTVSLEEKIVKETLHSLKSRIFFILQLGYFKARRQFFKLVMDQIANDIQFIQAQYFPDSAPIVKPVAKVTRLKHQQMILSLFDYRHCNTRDREELYGKAEQLAQFSARPVIICRELLHHLQQQDIVLPGYRILQDTISQALICEQTRLTDVLRQHLTTIDIEALQQLLDDTPGLYEITQLKQEPRNFKEGEIKRELRRGEQLQPLYRLAQTLIPQLGISRESVKYYASLVGYYSVYKLNRMDTWQVYVYLLCFANHRTQRLYDNMINSFLYHVRQFYEEARAEGKERLFEAYQVANKNREKAGQVLKLFTSKSIASKTPFHEVQASAFAILERDRLSEVADQIADPNHLDEKSFQWEHIEKMAPRFKRQLRFVLQAINFSSPQKNDPLIETIDILKVAFQQGRPLSRIPQDRLPVSIIPKRMERYLYETGKDESESRQLQTNRYEFWLYRQMRNALEAGDLYCRDSVRFRSVEDDLVDDQQWQNKETLIQEAGLTILEKPIQEHLVELEQQLERRIVEVNQRISDGENPYLQIRQKGRQQKWTLKNPTRRETVNHPFFGTLRPVNIVNVLEYVNQQCPFLGAFNHALGRFTRQSLDKQALFAALLAWGTNLSLGRMSERSDIDYQRLVNTSDNRIRLETLQEANDRISNYIAQLPVFRHYNLGDQIHSSSDGQKFETQTDTLNARHSPKYFGLKKGIVSYSLVVNHVPVNAQVIGANEHESHYVFDLLYNNTTDIEINTHSTDTHGTNQVNFALLYQFGHRFAPRYRDIYGVVSRSLVGFKSSGDYGDMLIKPVKKIKTDLIISEEDNIQRIMVSLARKTTTQSIITGKLSAYARKNRTKTALWEYDSIIQSLYLLDYIDSPPLRQYVHTALNRGESYHKLRRAIAYANFGKLRFKTEREQQIWNECSRLLTNCIILYNASLLSGVLELYEKAGDRAAINRLESVSPVAWAHINLFGHYEFGKLLEPMDLDRMIDELVRMPVSRSSNEEVLE